jgi:hypothetical protein
MSEKQNALAPAKDPKTGRFLAGNNGFGGRPLGARNKLGEAFIQALHDSFNEHGPETIEKVRTEKPDQYLKVIASLLPKDVNLNVNNEIEMSDDELRERIRQLSSTIAPFLAAGDGEAGAGAGAQIGADKPAQLH